MTERGGLLTLSWQGSMLANKRDGSGLEYMRNRMYDPKTGRFTQEDPIGLAGGLNLYGYANGDPVNFSDPFGLWPSWDGIKRAAWKVGAGLIGLIKAGLPHDTPEPPDMITDPPPIEKPATSPTQDVDSARTRRSGPGSPNTSPLDIGSRIGAAWLTNLWARQLGWLSAPSVPALPPRVQPGGLPPLPPWLAVPIVPE